MAFTTLDECLRWIERQHPSAIELGLDRVASVARSLSIHFSCPVITVAGTNGKGSCVALLEAILLAEGYRTAAYTSPHLVRYNERVRIDGKDVGDAELCRAFNAVEQARQQTPLTYFEFGTLAAFHCFQQADVDVVILEVGLGGRLDAVNIIDADVAIVSSIDLDHQDWLGHDRESIAREKAGVFRAGRAAIMGDIRPAQAITDYARHVGSQLYSRGIDFDFQRQADRWSCRVLHPSGGSLQYDDLPLPSLLLDNAASVLQALACAPLTVSESAIRGGLQMASVTGRGQLLEHGGKPLMLDVAHNPAALNVLVERLARNPCSGRTVAVFSLLRDKPLDEMLAIMAGHVDVWHIAELQDNPRALSLIDLQAGLLQAGQYRVQSYANIRQAFNGAVSSLMDWDRLLVFGSFYTVAEVMAELNENNNGRERVS